MFVYRPRCSGLWFWFLLGNLNSKPVITVIMSHLSCSFVRSHNIF